MFTTFRECCMLPEKQIRPHCSFTHTFAKTFSFIQMQKHGFVTWANPKWSLFDILWNTRFDLSMSLSESRSMECNFLQLPYLQRYKDALVEKGTPLHNCFGFVDGTVARIFIPVFNKRMVYKGHKGTWYTISYCSFAKCLDYQLWRTMGRSDTRLCTILYELVLLNQLQRLVWFLFMRKPYLTNLVHLEAPYLIGNLIRDQMNCDEAMSKARATVKWLFCKIKTCNFF